MMFLPPRALSEREWNKPSIKKPALIIKKERRHVNSSDEKCPQKERIPDGSGWKGESPGEIPHRSSAGKTQQLASFLNKIGDRLSESSRYLRGLDAVLEGVDDPITAMATCACILHQRLPAASWTGFYRVVAPRLLRVGPYQGPLGCLEIPFDRGVCGAAARERAPQVVARRPSVSGAHRLRRGGALGDRDSDLRSARRARRRARHRFPSARRLRRDRSRGARSASPSGCAPALAAMSRGFLQPAA